MCRVWFGQGAVCLVLEYNGVLVNRLERKTNYRIVNTNGRNQRIDSNWQWFTIVGAD